MADSWDNTCRYSNLCTIDWSVSIADRYRFIDAKPYHIWVEYPGWNVPNVAKYSALHISEEEKQWLKKMNLKKKS